MAEVGATTMRTRLLTCALKGTETAFGRRDEAWVERQVGYETVVTKFSKFLQIDPKLSSVIVR
jgi:hypothetical protein